MKYNTRVRELFIKHTTEPCSINLLASKLNLTKPNIQRLISDMRKEDYVIWTIYTGDSHLIWFKQFPKKPKQTTKSKVLALIQDDWVTVKVLAALLYKHESAVRTHLKEGVDKGTIICRRTGHNSYEYTASKRS